LLRFWRRKQCSSTHTDLPKFVYLPLQNRHSAKLSDLIYVVIALYRILSSVEDYLTLGLGERQGRQDKLMNKVSPHPSRLTGLNKVILSLHYHNQ